MNDKSNAVSRARAVIRQAFAKDPDFRRVYVSNVAMLLHDELGVRRIKREEVAGKLLDLIFSK
jgi:hypothetical protein